jgi:hypothetical protein
MALKFAQVQKYTLAGSGAVIGATSITLTSMLSIDGVALVMADAFGDIGYATIDPNLGELEEQISFSGLTNNANGTTTLTGVKTVLFLSPYTQTSGLAKTHAGGATFVISNTSGFYDRIATGVAVGAWQSWTPTLSGGWLSAGNATFNCKYFQDGKFIAARVEIYNGTTTTYQAGNLVFTLPVPGTADPGYIGVALVQNAAVLSYPGNFQMLSSTTCGIYVVATDTFYSSSAVCTNSVPFTWGNGDNIHGTLVYEAA